MRSCWLIAETFGKRDYAHLAPHKKAKTRDAFKEWVYRRKEEDTVTDEFRRYSITGSAIPATERFDPIVVGWTPPLAWCGGVGLAI